MRGDLSHDKYDLARIIVRPLYFGMFANILIPGVLAFLCYWLNQNSPRPNNLGDSANTVFYLIGLISIVQALVAIWMRQRLLGRPLVHSEKTFEDDLTANLKRGLIPIMIIIALIAFYGGVYYFLTGRFEASLIIMLFSFVAFQVIRPRLRSARTLVERQEKMLARGQTFSD
ncbi:MAG TPA: hypothetical protein PLF13_04235 [candidate division Zixibacteria bacterium]|nr:hypothetical protein [candidate division Zixibacteria bacterium]